MFSRFQTSLLAAMGFVCYVPVAQHDENSAPKGDADFWQSPLGRNIARCAAGVNLAQLVIPTMVTGCDAKKALWQQLKALRKRG